MKLQSAIFTLICTLFFASPVLAWFASPPAYKGPGIYGSTRSLKLLQNFEDTDFEGGYHNAVIIHYFTEDKPGVPQAHGGLRNFCQIYYVHKNNPLLRKGTYFVKRDLLHQAGWPTDVWYREWYFGLFKNVRVMCAGSKNKMTKEYANRLMQGYIRIN